MNCRFYNPLSLQIYSNQLVVNHRQATQRIVFAKFKERFFLGNVNIMIKYLQKYI